MDPATAFVIVALMMLANGGVLGLVHRDLHADLQPSAVSWRIGTLMIAAGCILIPTQRHLPPGFVLPVANGLILLGLTGYWRALRQFDGLPDRGWVLLPALVGTLGVIWFTSVDARLGARVAVVTACWMVLFMSCAGTLLRKAQRDTAHSRRALAAIFLFAAAFALVRLVVMLDPWGAAIGDIVESGNWINVATPMMAGILPVVGTTAFLLMCSERVRRQWERAASTDYLTGLANRRTLADAGERAFARARRGEGSLAVAIIDIDHFKRVNDQYGHETGDLAIQYVATVLERQCRAGELPGRHGGEEFVVVATAAGVDEGRALGERLRQAVESTPFCADGIRLPITVSVGVAHLMAHDESFDRLLGRADAALYTAKTLGRNRVEFARTS